jgi:hypothetical protein
MIYELINISILNPASSLREYVAGILEIRGMCKTRSSSVGL